MARTRDGKQVQVVSVDAELEDADWTKKHWDFPPYKSAEFFEAIGGVDQLDEFRKLPAYRAAVANGIIMDDEWVLDWCEPMESEPVDDDTPGRPRTPKVNVHFHRGR